VADLYPLFVLADSAVVQAGAGTGKTHSLITLCLHLLGGAGRAEPLPPQRLCAVTFTEKAAAELSARLRQRVDRLA
jgi:ATP-dependent helicase/nuclease subunit A